MKVNMLKEELSGIIMAFFTENTDCNTYVNRLKAYEKEGRWQTLSEDFGMVTDSHHLTEISIIHPREFSHSFQIHFTYTTTTALYQIAAYFSVLAPYYTYTVEETLINKVYTAEEEKQKRVLDKLEGFLKEYRSHPQVVLSRKPIEERMYEHLVDIKALIDKFGHKHELTFDELMTVPSLQDIWHKRPQHQQPLSVRVAALWDVDRYAELENLFAAIHTIQNLSIKYERLPSELIHQYLGTFPVSCSDPQDLTCRQALFRF